MKKILLLLVVLVSSVTFAQNKGITYQAVIYSTTGESVPGIKNSNSPLSNKAICLQFSIGDTNSSTEYQEKVTVTTDDFGMVNLVIGNGTQTGGYANSFSTIVWSNPNKYLKVSVDQTGNCSSFELISDQILTYVPFALAANTATSVSGIVGIANGGTNATTVLGAKTNLQLQNVDNTSDLNKPIATLTQLALDNKVDMVAGKKLSTEDFTTAEKTKLASLGGTQDLSLLAPLLSPNFTGIPIAPTAAAGTNTTQLATTAFVNSTVASATNTNFVNLTGNQTVSGNKTFNNNITINSILVGKGSGIQSTLFGNAANATKDNTTAIGFMSLNGNSGISNTSVGTNAMRNSGLTSMSTAIGEGSGTGVTTGNGNTFLGHSANVTNNSAIENASSVGYQALVTSSNTIQLGNSNVTDVKTNGSYTGIGFKTPTGTSSQYLMADGSVSSGSSGSNGPQILTENQRDALNLTSSGVTIFNSTSNQYQGSVYYTTGYNYNYFTTTNYGFTEIRPGFDLTQTFTGKGQVITSANIAVVNMGRVSNTGDFTFAIWDDTYQYALFTTTITLSGAGTVSVTIPNYTWNNMPRTLPNGPCSIRITSASGTGGSADFLLNSGASVGSLSNSYWSSLGGTPGGYTTPNTSNQLAIDLFPQNGLRWVSFN